MPRPGEVFLGFKLIEELGRGAFARVFLAEQTGLSNRRVALKVTRRPSHEADKLARLQHTNIVPVYSVHNAAPIQAICMPFLGRRTIVDGLKEFHSGRYSSLRGSPVPSSRVTTVLTSKPLSGQHSSRYVRPDHLDAPEPGPDFAPIIGEVNAVLRTLSALASGLAHAHGRGILHLDIKPANVLIADTGEPMLLDFNLSFDQTTAARDIIGGTPQYMAPEQLADVKSHGHGQIDARTDLYNLGVLAHEMLTGRVPFPAPSSRKPDAYQSLIEARTRPLPALRDQNPAVPYSVEAIVRKLLSPNPDDRYQSAEELQEDLDRQLANRPLRHAAEVSLGEQLVKWRRRNPGLLRRFSMLFMVLALIFGGLWVERQASARAEIAAIDQAHATQSAMHTLRLDLTLANEAHRQRGIRNAESSLKSFGLPDDPEWRSQGAFARLPAELQAATSADLGEMLILLAETRWQDAQHDPARNLQSAASEALRLNRIARTCFAEDAVPPFVERQRSDLSAATGNPTDQDSPAEPARLSTTSRDHFLDAISSYRNARYEASVEPLERVITLEPDHAAAHYLLAACRHHLGQYPRALERYDMAQALMPHDPRPPFGRGLVYGLERLPDKAEVEFVRAIQLDPKYGEVYRNLASARYRLGKLELAEDDITQAIELGDSPLRGYYLRSQIRDASGDRDGADADRQSAATHTPRTEADFLARGYARIQENPRDAMADFVIAARLNPRSAAALINQVHLLTDRLDDLPAALVVADHLVEWIPEYSQGRAARAIVLARMGRRSEAQTEAEHALKLSTHPTITYQVACVYSITASFSSEHAAADSSQALKYLRRACRTGYRDLLRLERDPNLETVRKTPEFKTTLEALKELNRGE